MRRVGGFERGHQALWAVGGERAGHPVEDRAGRRAPRRSRPTPRRCDGDGSASLAGQTTPASAMSTGRKQASATNDIDGPTGPIGAWRRRSPWRPTAPSGPPPAGASGGGRRRRSVIGSAAYRRQPRQLRAQGTLVRVPSGPWHAPTPTRSPPRPRLRARSARGHAVREPAQRLRLARSVGRHHARRRGRHLSRAPTSSTWPTTSTSSPSAMAPCCCGAPCRTCPSVRTWRWSIPASAPRARASPSRPRAATTSSGPDNGLLMPAAARLGGITAAHLLEDARYALPDVSSSFHGRDLFAPAAAHLASRRRHRRAGPRRRPATSARPGVASSRRSGPGACAPRPSTSTPSATSSSRPWPTTSWRRCRGCASASGCSLRLGEGGDRREVPADLGPHLRRGARGRTAADGGLVRARGALGPPGIGGRDATASVLDSVTRDRPGRARHLEQLGAAARPGSGPPTATATEARRSLGARGPFPARRPACAAVRTRSPAPGPRQRC